MEKEYKIEITLSHGQAIECLNGGVYCMSEEEEEELRKEVAKKITTKEEAQEYAIDWQNWSSEQSLSYGELAEWGAIFSELAEKFDLTEEFKENGII